MSVNPLPLCPYRRSREGMLVCTIAKTGPTDVVNAEICRRCSIPEALAQVNCVHLTSGVEVYQAIGGGQLSQTFLDCEVVGFSKPDDYKDLCASCTLRFPIHLDLANEPPIHIPGFLPAEKPVVDRDLRQAILRALYAFHARHPERFGRFDVTPEFLAESLGVEVKDVVRVVLPMEEDGEVKTLGVPGEPYFRYVALTAKGIHAIDDELLFERDNAPSVQISELRNEGGNIAIAAGSAQVHQAVQAGANAEQLLARLEELLGPANDEIVNLLHKVRDALEKGDKDRAQRLLERLLKWGQAALEAVPLLNRLLQLLG